MSDTSETTRRVRTSTSSVSIANAVMSTPPPSSSTPPSSTGGDANSGPAGDHRTHQDVSSHHTHHAGCKHDESQMLPYTNNAMCPWLPWVFGQLTPTHVGLMVNILIITFSCYNMHRFFGTKYLPDDVTIMFNVIPAWIVDYIALGMLGWFLLTIGAVVTIGPGRTSKQPMMEKRVVSEDDSLISENITVARTNAKKANLKYGKVLPVKINRVQLSSSPPPPITTTVEYTPVSCRVCGTWKEADGMMRHCRMCNACSAGRDHHCIWVGTCVGRDNIRAFYLFVALAIGGSAFLAAAIASRLVSAYTYRAAYTSLHDTNSSTLSSAIVRPEAAYSEHGAPGILVFLFDRLSYNINLIITSCEPFSPQLILGQFALSMVVVIAVSSIAVEMASRRTESGRRMRIAFNNCIRRCADLMTRSATKYDDLDYDD